MVFPNLLPGLLTLERSKHETQFVDCYTYRRWGLGFVPKRLWSIDDSDTHDNPYGQPCHPSGTHCQRTGDSSPYGECACHSGAYSHPAACGKRNCYASAGCEPAGLFGSSACPSTDLALSMMSKFIGTVA